MAHVQVIQRHAHLAGPVRLGYVNGRDGKVAKAVLTAISNTRRSSADPQDEEPTAIQWTLWGKQAENAAAYLAKGSHVNVVGRLQNNNYEKDGEVVYGMTFTVEEIDYLDSRGDAEARRSRDGKGNPPLPVKGTSTQGRNVQASSRAYA
ncbi:single-stranded DNA-binding protein [Aquabacterium sp. J223]|uniref:single-stranded DNA-binding protein n=1 Tax=Aquabacterium sp. J223 TaxID=2898431 RepID=UPI0021ADFC16|nr:single-stranded DNA-binding protein [Aquabacterium sp. J223]UUX95400.1 single-stranded DNA-binding protein [Aquabacterium sp. J223]